MQASRFERLSFDPFSLLLNGFVTPEVDVRRRDVVDALVVALMIVVVDEGFNPPRPAGQHSLHHAALRAYTATRTRARAVLQNQAYPTTKGVYLGG